MPPYPAKHRQMCTLRRRECQIDSPPEIAAKACTTNWGSSWRRLSAWKFRDWHRIAPAEACTLTSTIEGAIRCLSLNFPRNSFVAPISERDLREKILNWNSGLRRPQATRVPSPFRAMTGKRVSLSVCSVCSVVNAPFFLPPAIFVFFTVESPPVEPGVSSAVLRGS